MRSDPHTDSAKTKRYVAPSIPYEKGAKVVTVIYDREAFRRHKLTPKQENKCEYPDSYEPGKEPYYPINDEKNNELFRKYADMDDTIAAALELWKEASKVSN